MTALSDQLSAVSFDRGPREAVYKRRSTRYRIVVSDPGRVNRGVVRMTLDCNDITGGDIALVDDGAEHGVTVVLG